MADRSLRFDLVARDKSFSKTLDAAGRKGERLNRQFTRTLGGTGDAAGRQFGLRFNKRLGAGLSSSVRVAKVGAAAIGAGLAVAGLAQFAKDSVQLAATFDKTMRQVAVATRTPAKRIGELRKVALDMGATTSFSAREAGDAMLALGKGGLTFAEQRAGALSATLTLAAAGSLELGEAADYVVQGLRAFGLRADKAATVAAALAGAANASTSNVEDMGLALSQTAAGARNAGLSIEETTGVLAAFANNGIRGSDAGTSLKTMLTRLIPTTDKAGNAMRALGLKFTDAHGAILPITEIAQRLQDRLGGLSDAQRTAALATIFGSDATRAATILMREGAAGLAKYIAATKDRGAAEKLAKTNTQGAAGAFERLQGAIETVQIQIGDAFLPMLADAANWLARVLPAALERVQSALQAAGHWWSENRYEIDLIVRSLTTGFNPAADQAATSTGNLADAASRIYQFLSRLAEAVARTSQGYNALVIASQAISYASGSAVMAIGHTINALESLGKWLRLSRDTAGHAGDAFIRFGDTLTTNAGNAIRNARTGIDQANIAINGLQTNTNNAATAANNHATALRNEKAAVDALKGALDDEKTSELDVRQAKLNVSTAQTRLNELKRAGKKGSVDYRQAQIDLTRAQIDLKRKTDDYRGAVTRSTDAERTAASASARAKVGVDKLGEAARVGGGKADRARIPWAKLGERVADTYAKIHSKTANITAKFGWQGLQVFRTPGGRLAFAEGGPVLGPGTETSDSIPARLSKGEYVVRAKAVRAVGRDTLDQINAQGFAAGGPVVPRFDLSGDRGFTNALGGWDRQVEKVLDLAARRFKKLAGRFGGLPGILNFIRSVDPLPYRWGAAGPGSYDCSGLVGAVYGKHTGRGGGHGQRYFTTATIGTGVPGLKPGLGGVLQIGVTPGRGHMAGRYGGLGFEAESTRTGIKVGAAASKPESFARQYHMAKGGLVDREMVATFAALAGLDIGGDQGKLRVNGKVFDRGGTLAPGLNVVNNATGRPEPLVPAADGIDYRRLGQEVARALRENPPVALVSPQAVQAGMNQHAGRMGQARPYR